ncbi:hypothetical protein BC941DRAFT_475610 [Chlamydoabsidia padenii]|nr:hypothetical protein BC941DRAFT_475610 [Chlamydoabsidia padenii]
MPPQKKQQPTANRSDEKINDPRFKKVHNDPRFLRPKKKDTKVTIDKRFKSMLTSKDFGTGAGPKVDKYGRKLEADSAEKELKRFYHIEEDEDDDSDSDDNKSLTELEKELMADEGNLEDEDSSDEEENSPLAFGQKGYDPMRGKGVIDDSDTSDEDIEEEVSESEQEDEIPQIQQGEETRRLALVNLDWDKVKSMDIYQVLNGFKPKTGVIERVSIYPSEFGKERIEKEEREGPPKEIFKATTEINKDDDSSDEEVTEKTIIRDQVEEGMGEDFDQEALRKYQLDRLKYYYAVVECDAPFTAKILYQSCDGNEYENSANFFDMRYIPDDMEFDDTPRDTCTQVPDGYKPLKFQTEALQHTRVKLTWDQDLPERVQLTRREFTEADLKNLDFDAYLASSDEDGDDSDDEQDVEAMRAKYRKLLANGDSNVYDDKTNDDDDDDDGDMEITFTPGLSEKTGGLGADDDDEEPKEETSIETYMRKQKEKRMAKKERRELENKGDDDGKFNKKKSGRKAQTFGESDNDEELEGDAFFKEARAEMEKEGAVVKDPKEKKKNKKKKLSKEERMEQKRQKAELELLMGDDQTKGEGFDMKQVLKREKLEKKKGKTSRKEKELLQSTTDDFEINVQDPRFAALQDSHHFAIDPTNPQFKKTKNMKKLMEARQSKLSKEWGQGEEWKKNVTTKTTQPTEDKQSTTKSGSLSQLVDAVKRKGALTQPKLGKRQKQ